MVRIQNEFVIRREAISNNTPRLIEWFGCQVNNITTTGSELCEKIRIATTAFFEAHSPKLLEWSRTATNFLSKYKISIALIFISILSIKLLNSNYVLIDKNTKLQEAITSLRLAGPLSTDDSDTNIKSSGSSSSEEKA